MYIYSLTHTNKAYTHIKSYIENPKEIVKKKKNGEPKEIKSRENLL